MQDESHPMQEREDVAGHISNEESVNLYGAPAFAVRSPQSKS